MVPNLGGLTEDDAVAELEEAGYRARVRRDRSFQPDGTVFLQSPAPGARLDSGGTVQITVSSFKAGTPPPRPPTGVPIETVPRVVGLSLEQAGERMQVLGLIDNTYPVASGRRQGFVIAQNPTGGTELRRGARVRLNVSLGTRERARVSVPNTVELTDLVGHFSCRSAGLTCKTVLVADPRRRLKGRIVRQWPRPGRAVLAFTQMKLYVAR